MVSSNSVFQYSSELESATIQKQRKELQLLILELKDRDQELNDMVAAHQKQLLAWEEDRQRVLTLEQRCSRLEGTVETSVGSIIDYNRSKLTRLPPFY